MSELATRRGGRRGRPGLPAFMLLAAMLPALGQAQTVNICDRTEAVRFAIVRAAGASDCAAVSAAQMDGIEELELDGRGIASLKAGDFAGLTGLEDLELDDNQLTDLPLGVFDRLVSLSELRLNDNQLTALPAGVFDGLINLSTLLLNDNQLEELPPGIFSGLSKLFDLYLSGNQLTALPPGIFSGLRNLGWLILEHNRLTKLPPGIFTGLGALGQLNLADNRLTTLPPNVFSDLTELYFLDLSGNHLVGLTEADLPSLGIHHSFFQLYLGGQTEPPEGTEEPEANATRLAAAVPLMLSASDSMRQGFVRIINLSNASGMVRILAFDDGGTAADPVEVPLAANQAVHFNAGDLENGNAGKGINAGVGSPIQGDWRLDIETALDVRVLAFVRTTDGFLTAMGDVLPRDAEGRLAAQTFNPGSNSNQVSKLRLVNTGANAERVSIEGVDDRGATAGPVTLTLAAGESRTFLASDLENGAQGLAGTLGDGAGKWRLSMAAGPSVVGISLLESVTGHLTNISSAGVATEGQ